MSIKPMNDWILVEMDPEKQRIGSGLLYKPDGSFESMFRTGVVVAVGPGRLAKKEDDVYKDFRIPTGLKVGDGVIFNRFIATETKTAQSLHFRRLESNEALLRPNDIVLVFDREFPIEVE